MGYYTLALNKEEQAAYGYAMEHSVRDAGSLLLQVLELEGLRRLR